MTRGELKTYVKRNIGDTIADIFDDTYLNLMLYQEVLEVQEWIEGADQHFFLKATPLDVSMQPNDVEITLPPDFNKAIDLRAFTDVNDVNESGQKIFILDIRDKLHGHFNDPYYPDYYHHPVAFIKQNKIEYEKPLGRAHTARLQYSFILADLNNDSESWSEIPVQWHQVIALGVIVKALSSEDSDTTQWERRLNNARDNMVFSITRRNKQTPRYVNIRG